MNDLKLKVIIKIVNFVAFAIFSLVFTFNAFSSDNIPTRALTVLGHGYDLTFPFIDSTQIRRSVFDMNGLNTNGKIISDTNIGRFHGETFSGSNITEYMENLARNVGLTVSGGASGNPSIIRRILPVSAAFSRETERRFGSDRVNRQEYEFATKTTIITREAFFIRDDNLTLYLNPNFIYDVINRTPQEIISRYGTHVMLGGLFGARLDYNMSVRRTRETDSTTRGNLVENSFNAAILGVRASANHRNELQESFGRMFDVNTIRVTTTGAGGRTEFIQNIHNELNWDAWINSIDGNVVWSGFHTGSGMLVPLYEFIVAEHFGADTQRLMANLRNSIHRYLGNYEDATNFGWTRDGQGGITITGYIGQSSDVVIPSTINGMPTRGVRDNAFRGRNLSSVDIPNSVISIGDNAFSNNQLISVNIPSSIQIIGTSIFENNRLTSVTIPSSVISIGDNAFSNNQLISVTIPNSVFFIGCRAFSNNQLVSVTIPNSAYSIGDDAFAGNSSLVNIIIGENARRMAIASSWGDRWTHFIRDYADGGGTSGTYIWSSQLNRWERQ